MLVLEGIFFFFNMHFCGFVFVFVLYFRFRTLFECVSLHIGSESPILNGSSSCVWGGGGGTTAKQKINTDHIKYPTNTQSFFFIQARIEEQSIYDRCGSKNMYLNFAVKTVKKLRDHGSFAFN